MSNLLILELDTYSELTPLGREYVTLVRESEPSRMVGTHAKKNVVAWIPSQKMSGVTISVESTQGERAFLILCEYDQEVIEIWDQPEPIRIKAYDKNGLLRNQSYTPDFLIIKKNNIEVVEVKTEEEIRKLESKYPKNWVREIDGGITYLPAENYFKTLGVDFRVFAYRQSLKNRIKNIETILSARNKELFDRDTLSKVNKALEETFTWTLEELRKELKLESYTALIQMVDKGILKCCINDALIDCPNGFVVSSNASLLKEAKSIMDNKKILNKGGYRKVSRRRIPSKKEALKALERINRIDSGEKSRSVYRWKKLIKLGRDKGYTDFMSLLPVYYQSGNRVRKLNKVVDDYLKCFIRDHFSARQGLTIYTGHKEYQVLAKKEHPDHPPVSRTTFSKTLRKLSDEKFYYKRGGKRLANANSSPTDHAQRSITASFAWEKVAIDHYLAEIFLIVYKDNDHVFVQKPWITAMIDQYSSAVLAFTISFRSPSKVAVSKVMRHCVRTHKKLPKEIIVDRGAEFKSVYFASLLAHYSVINSLRPSGNPRFGATVEKLFGEFQSQHLTQLEGNSVGFNKARTIDGDKLPSKAAILSPEDFYRQFRLFIDWRNNKCRGKESESSLNKLITSEIRFPFIAKKIEYNEEFLLVSAVESKDYKVDFNRGIHIGDRWYWDPDILKIRGYKSRLTVRIDPENPYVVYVLIDSGWVSCYATDIQKYLSNDDVNQFTAGLLELEARNLRWKIKELNSRELISAVHSLNDEKFSGPKEPNQHILEKINSTDDLETIETRLDLSDFKSLTLEEWDD